MVQGDKKRIVLCADDFGMNPAIDEGILKLAERRRLSATSCLVEGPSFASGVDALRQSGLQLGLHLNFTESMGQPGLYMPVSSLIRQAYLRRLDSGAVASQVQRQLDRYEALVGRPPDFVDGHQHVHQLPQIRTVLLVELAKRYPSALPWLRNTRAGSLQGMPARLRAKAAIIEYLGSHALARVARRAAFSLNPRFLGVYDFTGGHESYRRWMGLWLAGAADGDLIMCHPAAGALPGDDLGPQRKAEFDVLLSPSMGSELDRHGLILA
ncbi:MAG TPA: ChbG/HpnK family deacetylase [Burkholderiaceae bacterium]|nr:ChbG/HpnK family deacetylase [Burkholderiaceae bacterium]